MTKRGTIAIAAAILGSATIMGSAQAVSWANEFCFHATIKLHDDYGMLDVPGGPEFMQWYFDNCMAAWTPLT